MVEIPARWASSGVANRTGSPWYLSSPPSGGYTPVSTLIKVDLPAPFSPTSACTSPAWSSSETPSSAVTPAKCFVMPTAARAASCGDRSVGGGSLTAEVRRPAGAAGADTRCPGPQEVSASRFLIRSVGVFQLGLGIVGRVLAVGDDRDRRDAGAAVEVLERLERERTEARVGLDDTGDPSVDDPLHGTLGAVDRDDLHVSGGIAGRLQGGDGAERHLVVVGVDGVDVGIVGDQLFGDRLAHRALVVGGLLSHDLDVVVDRVELLHEAVVAIGGDVHAGRAEQDRQAGLAAGLADHRVGGAAALLDEVRADPADVVLTRGLRGEEPVDGHDRHTVLACVVEGRVEALAVERRDDQCVDALVDHALDVRDLLVEVGLGVRHDEVDAASGGLVANRLGLGDAERVGLALGLGEADGRSAQVDGLAARAAVLVVAAVLSGRRGDLLADPARGVRRRGAGRCGTVATDWFGAAGGRQAL